LTGVAARDESRNEFLRRSLWRNRTTPRRRAIATALTFALLVVFGGIVMALVMTGLDRLSAPDWVVWSPWLAPTVGVLSWALARPSAAILSDDDDDKWTGYSVRVVIIGSDTPRPRPVRAIATVLFGAPVAWSYGVLFLLELTGIF
jgi:hypothetical protein